MSEAHLHLVVLWIVIVGGLVPSLYFVWSWRPQRRWAATQLDAGGWVAVIAALYMLAAVRAAMGQYKTDVEPLDWFTTAGIGLAIDFVLWLRVLRWRAFRRDENAGPQRRATDPPDPGTCG